MGRVFEWLLPQPVDDCLRVLASCLLGGKEVTPLMCSTTETVGSNSSDGEEDTVSFTPLNTAQHKPSDCVRIMCSHRWPLSDGGGGAVQDLVEAVLSLMGLKADAVGENDNLAALGIDSMQLMEVWNCPLSPVWSAFYAAMSHGMPPFLLSVA